MPPEARPLNDPQTEELSPTSHRTFIAGISPEHRLKEMIRRTLKAIGEGEELLKITRKLVWKSELHNHLIF